ncbi:MAG: hydroxyisourate hydrolase [Acidobacteriota bacterium]|nr:hydroxyisourate hydrolase [Acidobacteriota bacterium]
MSAITTHILDVSAGVPARGVGVTLERRTAGGDWEIIGKGATDGDGRLRDLLDSEAVLQPGDYRLTFETGAYFAGLQIQGFYPQAAVTFTVRDAAQHYHVPLLLSPFGYSTYRGS